MVFGNNDIYKKRSDATIVSSHEVFESSILDIILVNAPILNQKGEFEYRQVFRYDNGVPTLPMKLYTRIQYDDDKIEKAHERNLFVTLIDPGMIDKFGNRRGSRNRVIAIRKSNGDTIYTSNIRINDVIDMVINKKRSGLHNESIFDINNLGTPQGMLYSIIENILMAATGTVSTIYNNPSSTSFIYTIKAFASIVETYMLMLCRNDFINHKSQFDPLNKFYDNAIDKYRHAYYGLSIVTANENDYLATIYPDDYVLHMLSPIKPED